MDAVIIVVAFLASGLTLVSGFGLGTIMLPVFAAFFNLELAIALTAIVHILNNVFKFVLLRKKIDKNVLLLFGVPGILGAFLGAVLLNKLASVPHLEIGSWQLSPINTSIGLLMIFFASTELFPGILKLNFTPRFLIPGGLVSGFFGGLSGHQGALRSMFLIKANLAKEVYIATGVGIALLVDFTRIPVYFSATNFAAVNQAIPTLIGATLAAILGAYLSKRYIKKITLRSVHVLVGIMMIFVGLGLIFNWI